MRLAAGQAVALPEAVAHHALKVLRLRQGDALVLFDGTGGEYPATIIESGRHVQVRLDARRELECEAPLSVTLIQALPSGDKMDLVIQKAVELGVAAIQPVQAKRSVLRLTGERAHKRLAHWQQVAISACEQSGRNRVPEVHDLLALPDYLATLTVTASRDASVLRLLLSPHHALRLSELPQVSSANSTHSTHSAHAPSAVQLLVGPEGGFEAAEEDMARAAGFQPVRLGPRVLRTETAGLAALAALMTLWGDF